MMWNPNLNVPEPIARMALDLKIWMETHNAQSIYGMGDVNELQWQLAEVTAERDALRATLQNIRDELENAK